MAMAIALPEIVPHFSRRKVRYIMFDEIDLIPEPGTVMPVEFAEFMDHLIRDIGTSMGRHNLPQAFIREASNLQ